MTLPGIYQRLDINRREIRLLELLPGHGTGPIRSRLLVISFDELPNYEALSYVWGVSEDNDDAIEISDVPVRVTHNLKVALQDLRYDGITRLLWIDALCINQGDLEEKSSQIQLMSRIYREASCVVVHLPGFSPAFSKFLSHMATNPGLHWSSELEEFGKNRGCQFPLFGHMFGLFRAPWWSRVWTLQEAVLASELSFNLGGCPVTLSTMVRASRSFTSHYKTKECCREEGVLSSLPLNIWTRMKILDNILDISHQALQTKELTFSKVLIHNRHREATNELDHVFGVLGLLPGSESMIDYSCTSSEVYQQSVLYDIRKTNTLDILSQVIVPDGTPAQETSIEDLPSWVPNWKQEYYPYYLEDVSRRQDVLHLYNACGSEPARDIHYAEGYLGLQGVVVDRIVALGESMPPSHITSNRNPILFPNDRLMLPPGINPLDKYPYSRNTYADAHWSTVEAGICLAYKTGADDAVPARHGDPEVVSMKPVGFMGIATSQRRKMRTARGYLGLAPNTAQLHDLVCVLWGGKVPYIIRVQAQGSEHHSHGMHAECTYSFIGEGYVHGLMDGEVLALVASGSLTQELIVLGGKALTAQDVNTERSGAHMVVLEQGDEIRPEMGPGVDNPSDEAPEMQSNQLEQQSSQQIHIQDGLGRKHEQAPRTCCTCIVL